MKLREIWRVQALNREGGRQVGGEWGASGWEGEGEGEMAET